MKLKDLDLPWESMVLHELWNAVPWLASIVWRVTVRSTHANSSSLANVKWEPNYPRTTYGKEPDEYLDEYSFQPWAYE